MTVNLDAFFRPRGVAVIGASAHPAKIGGRRFRTLVEGGYRGGIYPVNPRAGEILGHRVYASISDVPDPVDLAIVMVRAELVPETVDACARREISAVMVITAGFGEVSDAGTVLEREMVQQLRAYGGRLMGPNCAGLFDAREKLNIGGLEVPAGPIGVMSQSGNMVLDFARLAKVTGSGFSRCASIGNAADVRPIEVIANLLDDDATSVVLAYLEGWAENEGRRLHDLVRNHPAGKPVVILKPGRSEVGRKAALSHTGSLAGEDRIVDAAFRQAGIWRAANASEAWHVALALSRYPPLESNQVVILADGGGHATLLADALGVEGLAMPTLDASTQEALHAVLPARSVVRNPIDFAGVAEERPSAWVEVAEICRQLPEIGVVAMAGHFGGYHDNGGAEVGALEAEAARGLAALHATSGAPLLAHSIHALREKPALETLQSAGVSVFSAPHELARVLGALRAASTPRRGTISVDAVTGDDRANAEGLLHTTGPGTDALSEPDARAFLRAAEIAVPRWRVDADPLALGRVSAADGPVALKLIAPGLVHRSDAGGVMLDIEGQDDIAVAARVLLDRAAPDLRDAAQVMSTPMIGSGLETVFGALRNPHFGPVLMFGLGGIHLEVIDDVVFRLAPLAEDEAHAMLGAIRAHRLLDGHRGSPSVNLKAAARLLVQLGNALIAYPAISEIDLNPVFLSPHGAAIADARVILGPAT